MSIRQRLNDNPRIVAVVAGALVLIALLMMFLPRSSGGGGGPTDIKEFYSVDDGKTWFVADAAKLPPFDHQGKPAVRARVFKCPHGKEFVSHLERYADADRKQMESLIEQDKSSSREFIHLESNLEVKKPGGKDWVKTTPQNGARINALRMPKCPEGSTAGIVRVSAE